MDPAKYNIHGQLDLACPVNRNDQKTPLGDLYSCQLLSKVAPHEHIDPIDPVVTPQMYHELLKASQHGLVKQAERKFPKLRSIEYIDIFNIRNQVILLPHLSSGIHDAEMLAHADALKIAVGVPLAP